MSRVLEEIVILRRIIVLLFFLGRIALHISPLLGRSIFSYHNEAILKAFDLFSCELNYIFVDNFEFFFLFFL